MLNYWTIQIRCEKDIEGYNLANAKRIHGFLFETISKYNRELASFHHDKQKKQSFSISTIFNEELLNENDLEKINANVLLKNVDINTEYVEYDKFKVFGFIGNVILEIKFDDKILQEKSEILLALAEFVGLGYKTGMGMGKCLIQKV